MKVRTILKIVGAALALLLIVGLVAPYLAADQYGKRLQWSLERALGRQVEIADVRFSLFKGPGFSVGRVTIHEDPSIGIEPIAYVQDPGVMEVVPSLWSLLGGRFVISSIRLEDASINLTKTGPASGAGRWNFVSFVNRSVLSAVPAIHVRNSRINFKFGDTKSVFYLTDTDLDISPPGASGRGGWSVYCSAKPARTDRPAQGLGWFTVKGRWYTAPERLDLDIDLERTGLGDLSALWNGQEGGIHGTISSRLHAAGPLQNVGIQGRLSIEDVHRWDLLPPHGQGWTLDIGGRVDLLSQQLELQSSSPPNSPLPLSVRFRAADYLSQPHWAVALNWNRFPVEPLMELARHMGAQFPPKLKVSGSMDGAIGYSGAGSFQGQLAFHDAAVTIPDSPPVAFDQAYLVVDHGHVRLSPALVRTADQDEARIEADYDMNQEALDLDIFTDEMKVASLRSQVALAAVPWLEQVRSGKWKGELHYHREPAAAGWSGRLELADAQIGVPGFAHPLELASARAQISGARVMLDRLQARAGKVAFTGEYRYEPGAPRPHRVRLHATDVDAADLEAELMPTLRRSSGLIARALGRTSVPDWLAQRSVDGTIQIDDLLLAGAHLESLRARLLWDVTRVDLDGLQAKLDRAAIAGRLAVNLRGARPSYKLAGTLKGWTWQSGKVDAEGALETTGTGEQLLANLTSEGAFTGSGLDFGPAVPFRTVAGNYGLSWTQSAPRWRFTSLNLRTDEETYTGRGATGDDGRLIIVLNSGSKEMRLSGSLAKPKLDEAVRP
jgi:hypothetical protein